MVCRSSCWVIELVSVLLSGLYHDGHNHDGHKPWQPQGRPWWALNENVKKQRHTFHKSPDLQSYRLQKTCLWSSWFVAVIVELLVVSDTLSHLSIWHCVMFDTPALCHVWRSGTVSFMSSLWWAVMSRFGLRVCHSVLGSSLWNWSENDLVLTWL